MGLGEERGSESRDREDLESPERTTHRHTRRAESCDHVYSNSSEASQKVTTFSVHKHTFRCSSLFTQLLLKTADQLCGVVGGVVALCLVAGVAFLIFKKKTTGGSVRSPKAATTVAPE